MRVALIEEAGEGASARVGAAVRDGAELVCLPQLSFAPYLPAGRDRAGLELAERPVAAAWRRARAAAEGAWLAASAYESEGEGVFYLTARLAPGGPRDAPHAGAAGDDDGAYRQVALGAEPGRYEQLFLSPGHTGYRVVETPFGPVGHLVGSDLLDPDAWNALLADGARAVVGGASESVDRWPRARRAMQGLSAAHGVPVAVANRGGEEDGVAFPGEGLATDAAGEAQDADDRGHHVLEVVA